MGRAGRGGGSRGRSGGFSGGRRSGGFSGGGRAGRSFGSRPAGRRPPPGGPPVWHAPRGGPVFWGSRYPRGGPARSGCGCGGFSLAASIFAAVFVVMVAFVLYRASFLGLPGGGGSVAASTVEREPLPAGSVEETGYYTDELGWIVHSSALTEGMESFYRETGVQPYLYLTDSVDGSSGVSLSELTDYSARLYGELFTDEAHFLVVFFESGGVYQVGYTVGAQAKSILDDEAMRIFADYLDRYYYEDISEEEFFSRTFADTAERIMHVTRSPWPAVLAVLGVAALALILFFWWKKHKEQKAREQKQMEDLLNTPLESFGDAEAEQRAKKYEESFSRETGRKEL